MRFKPSLIVKRLIVLRNEHTVYDEMFHAGVNVIRGENSSGKSTILNCIYYGMGGDLSDWSETASLCTRVVIEVELNGMPATLGREISLQSGQPMELFGGNYETAKRAPRDSWLKYPYRRNQSQESFSQAVFRLLGLPEVANDVSGNLTMHQILRLLYADQLSPIETLFRYETRYDSPLIRDAVGRVLCGSFDNRVYQNDILIRDKTREFDAADGQLKSLISVAGKMEHSLTLEWVETERRALISQQSDIQHEIEKVEQEVFSAADSDKLTLQVQNEAYSEVQRAQSELASLQLEHDRLSLSMADSTKFIRSLEQKLSALSDADAVANHLGDVRFTICPACLSPVAEHKDDKSCHLCHIEFEGGQGPDRIVATINDSAIQLKQSQQLQSVRESRLKNLQERIIRINAQWRQAANRLSSAQRLPSTEAREKLRSLHRAAGYIERQIEDLVSKEALIRLIDEASAKKALLNSELSLLKSENAHLRASQERQLSKAKTEISEEIKTLLRNDLRRQDSFENPQTIQFGFESNSITVDGQRYFSASSRVILKSSFFLGFFAAATKDWSFRHPRFVMIDTIEDKGMEPERSHNFQNQILRVSCDAKCEHQIIYATAMISPDLDDEQFLVGRFYTRDEPTLAIG